MVKLESNKTIPCDIFLIKGSCLVDESILTGESVPITKIHAESDRKVNSLNIVYGGSTCIFEKSDQVLGIVINTGWNNFKGKIISGTLDSYKKPNLILYQMIRITMVFVSILMVCLLGLLLYDFLMDQLYMVRFLKYMTDLVIKGVQPSSWFILFVSVYIISTRLNSSAIAILKPLKLFNVGLTDTICFDKTGTLTQNKILFHGVLLRNSENEFSETLVRHMKEAIAEEKFQKLLALSSCCHDLFIHEHKLIGDPIDLELFKFSGSSMNIIRNDMKYLVGERRGTLRDSTYIRPQKFYTRVMGKKANFGYGIIKVFPFSSDTKRMGVLVKGLNNLKEIEKNDKNSYFTNKMMFESKEVLPNMQNSVFLDQANYSYVVKGAAQSIKKICRPSTIPKNFDQKLNEYAKQGLRIIALASKSVNSSELTQTEYEADMDFLGLMLFDNPLKESSKRTIDSLKFNNIDCKMITGDHLYSAINVGYMSGVIDQTESVFICSLDQEREKLFWQFLTFEELIKAQKDQKFEEEPVILEKRSNKVSVQHSQRQSISRSMKSIITSHKHFKSQLKLTDMERLPQIVDLVKNLQIQACLAMEGSCFDYIMDHPTISETQKKFILKKTKIFGRSTPDQKKGIVEALCRFKNSKNLCVGFVGDGANDFKALNNADFGLSIENPEASIASPFTSPQKELTILEDLIIEGKWHFF